MVTAEARLKHIASDFTQHFSTNWESGKAMFVAIDKITAVRMHNFIRAAWDMRAAEVAKEVKLSGDDQERLALQQKLEWMQSTEIAVIV